FIAVHQHVHGPQGWLRIAGAQQSVLHVLALVGVDALIPCHPTVEQALNACPLHPGTQVQTSRPSIPRSTRPTRQQTRMRSRSPGPHAVPVN
ncbi:hypothetical protein ACFWWC_49985, partial [Streptomyces sp. NPDC058642]